MGDSQHESTQRDRASVWSELIHTVLTTIGPQMNTGTNRWDWPDDLDALTAAPGNHQLLHENERVRVLLTTIPIGCATPVHTHRWSSVEYLLSATNFIRFDADGKVLFDTRVGDACPQASD